MMLFLLEKVAGTLIKKNKPIVICITGSVGKTSVKNAISYTLDEVYDVRSTPKNINNEFGVPISVIGNYNFKEGFFALLRMLLIGLKQLILHKFPKILVIEVGAGKIGEVERISKWLKPNILMVTNLPNKPSHLGVFGSRENILKEKKFLADVMDKEGIMFIDDSELGMDSFIENFKGKVERYNSQEFISKSNYSVIYDVENEMSKPVGIEFLINIYNNQHKLIFFGFIGKQNIKAILLAKTVGERFNLESNSIILGLEKYKPEPGRLNVLQGKKNNVTIIDDSFNSSPVAVENGLETLLSLSVNRQRKIAVLGDMLNFGNDSDNIHKNTAIKYIQQIDILITVGDKSKNWQSFSNNKLRLNMHFRNATESAEYIRKIWEEGDIFYFKGGYLIRLEKAVKILSKCSEKDLVRQEKYWQKPKYELFN